jgi:hypothetical protein
MRQWKNALIPVMAEATRLRILAQQLFEQQNKMNGEQTTSLLDVRDWIANDVKNAFFNSESSSWIVLSSTKRSRPSKLQFVRERQS